MRALLGLYEFCKNSSCFSGNGNRRESRLGLFFGNKLELEYSLRFPKAGNGNGNEVMGMGGNGYTKVISAHLYRVRQNKRPHCAKCIIVPVVLNFPPQSQNVYSSAVVVSAIYYHASHVF